MVEETRSVGVPAECRRSTASLRRAPKSDRDLPAEAGKKELDITPAKAGNPDEEGHRRAADVDDRKKILSK